MDRRLFLKGVLATGGVLGVGGLDALRSNAYARSRPMDGGTLSKPGTSEQSLADTLLSHAKSLGATYCDVRLVRVLSQSVNARNAIITGLSDNESYGVGVRVIKNGCWGFSGTRDVTPEGAKLAVAEACRIAESNAKLRIAPLDLAPVEPHVGEWKTPIKKDPFSVSFKDRAQFLLDMHALGATAAMGGRKLTLHSELRAVREEKYFASSEGSKLWQEVTRIDPSTWATVVDPAKGEFATRALFVLPQGRGFEYVEEYPYKEEIKQAAEEASEKITAIPVEAGKYDLILHPTHLWLTIHESVGHPTELDRIMGYEANFAGTSFLPREKWDGFSYGSKRKRVAWPPSAMMTMVSPHRSTRSLTVASSSHSRRPASKLRWRARRPPAARATLRAGGALRSSECRMSA